MVDFGVTYYARLLKWSIRNLHTSSARIGRNIVVVATFDITSVTVVTMTVMRNAIPPVDKCLRFCSLPPIHCERPDCWAPVAKANPDPSRITTFHGRLRWTVDQSSSLSEPPESCSAKTIEYKILFYNKIYKRGHTGIVKSTLIYLHVKIEVHQY